MILDDLSHGRLYRNVHPGFAAAFEFLQSTKLAELPLGKHELQGERLVAIAMREPGRGRAGAKLEAHRKFIDIQFTVDGCDTMGWRELADCRRPDGDFDLARDVGFFADSPDTWLAVPAGHFTVFHPHDAHAPLAGEAPVHKVVMKVAVAWGP